MFYFGPNRCQTPVTVCYPGCGVEITVVPSTNVARTCGEIMYTVTVTNSSDTPCRDCVLSMAISEALYANPDSITINGTPIADGDLTRIEIGTIGPGETLTMTYVTLVMECQRYIKTRARLECCVCCCFELKPHIFESKTNVCQVCCCCTGGPPGV